jgi:hypothetical protein
MARLQQTGTAAFDVALVSNGRVCRGRLLLSPQEVSFLCVHDESLAAGVAGKAVARQFGLVGGLIGGAGSAARSVQREKAMQATLAAMAHLPLDQQLAHHPASFRLGPREVSLAQKKLMTSRGEYVVHEIGESDLQLLLAWLGAHGASVQL